MPVVRYLSCSVRSPGVERKYSGLSVGRRGRGTLNSVGRRYYCTQKCGEDLCPDHVGLVCTVMRSVTHSERRENRASRSKGKLMVVMGRDT